MQENDEFVVIKFKQVSGLTVVLNGLGSPKLRTIDHENSQKTRKQQVFGHALKHISGLRVILNLPEIPKNVGNSS